MKTELGKKLARIRQDIVDSGEPLLDWDELPTRTEVSDRRLYDAPKEDDRGGVLDELG